MGSVTRKKICRPPAPSMRAASSSSVPCSCISGISSRATNGKVTKMVASTMPGHGEDDLDVVLREPRAEQPLRAEQQHVDQAGDHRRDRERQIDQRDQQALAPELELRDRPGGGDAEDEVERHGDRRDQQGEPDRGERIRLGDAGEIGAEPLAQRLDEHREQRQQQEQRRGTRAPPRSAMARTAGRSAVTAPRAGTGRPRRASVQCLRISALARARPALQQVDREQQQERQQPASRCRPRRRRRSRTARA